MNVGRRVDYAVRALTYLAGQRPGEVIARTEIEKKQDIPSLSLQDYKRSGRERVGSLSGRLQRRV